jgi:hypothetical protein
MSNYDESFILQRYKIIFGFLGAKVWFYFVCCFSLRSFDFRQCSKVFLPFPFRSNPFLFVQNTYL